MIVAQLGFRAWAIYGSWFQFDDFSFMSRVMNQPLSESMSTDYAGHLMPAGFFLTWLNTQVDPLNFTLPATELLLLQALASVGALVFLVSAFGRRPAILAPLAIFLASVISLPAFIWWAAGINQLPFLAAIFWGGWAHLNYLRSRRLGWAVASMTVTVASLAFYEKTLLIFILFAFLALAYFATGDIVQRLTTILARYRTGVILYSTVAVGYLALYVKFGLNYDPNRTNEQSLMPVLTNMAGYAFSTGILGGPLSWEYTTDLFAVPSPTQIVTLVAVGILGVLAYELSKTRLRSKRAWILVAAFLTADIVLVTGARASFVGPVIALDYRYQTELAAITAIALGLAILPLRDAEELVEVAAPSNFLDHWKRTAGAVVAVCVLAVYSSSVYINHWQSALESKTYFTTLAKQLAERDEPVPLVDVGVPGFLMWAFAYPENSNSHVLRMFEDDTYYPKITTDTIYMIADNGEIRPMVINPVRRADDPRARGCPWPVRNGQVDIPLDGPVIGGGWWVRAAYVADTTSPLEVTAGDSHHETEVRQGLHSLFFRADGDFDSIQFSGVAEGTTMCVSELELGLPSPLPAATS